MLTLLAFSFAAGFITILSPCIWPLLPIVFSVSSGGGKRKSLGITLGVMISFTAFTLFISYLVKIFPIDPNGLRLLSTIIIALLGLSLLIPSLSARVEVFINHLLGPLQSRFKKEGSGLGAGLVTGFALGLVWAPCAGPILAAIATLAATQAVNSIVIAMTLAYVLGLGIPLFIFSSLSARWFAKMRRVNKYTGRIQQFFGLIMIITAVLIYTNYDKVIQVKVLNAVPGYSHFLGGLENNASLQKQLNVLTGNTTDIKQDQGSSLRDKGQAPAITGITQWLNSSPLTLADLRGKVVLVDFWTYSCINCVRTLPHLTAWYQRYHKDGLVIIGVHTPEFAFEKDPHNVANALKEFHITYPVALDNNYATWKNYQNHYWPAEYLIDAKGHVRRRHFGEGEYDQMEAAIRSLLKESGHNVGTGMTITRDQTPQYNRTPETYLGLRRLQRFSSPEKPVMGVQSFSFPEELAQDHWALQGSWNMQPQYAQATMGATLAFEFKADKVFLVVGPVGPNDHVQVFLDGTPAAGAQAGADVQEGLLHLDRDRLYSIIDLKGKPQIHRLRLEFQTKGTRVYAFTFG